MRPVKKSCVLCARGYVRGAWEDKITMGKVQVAVATAMKVKRRAEALSLLFWEAFYDFLIVGFSSFCYVKKGY